MPFTLLLMILCRYDAADIYAAMLVIITLLLLLRHCCFADAIRRYAISPMPCRAIFSLACCSYTLP